MSDRSVHALVTGGAGFIGSHVVDRLLAAGWRVRVLDNFTTGHPRNLPVHPNLEIITGDVADLRVARRAVAGCDTVFHLAAKVFVPESFELPDEYERVNHFGARQLVEEASAAGVRQFVFSSTCAVYGNPAHLPIGEATAPDPLSPYARTKLAAEASAAPHARLMGFTALRYFNVFGSRQDPRSTYSGVISRFADALRKDEEPTIFGDGRQTRDFIHVSDVVAANLAAAARTDAGVKIFNVGRGEELAIGDVLALMQEEWRRETGRIPRPACFRPARTGDIVRSVADSSRLQRELGWTPQMDVAKGLRALLQSEQPNRPIVARPE